MIVRDAEKGWIKSIYHDGNEYILDQLELLSDLKTQIDHYYYGQSEEKELEQYALLSQEKIEGGAMLVGDFKNNLTSSEYKNCFQAERMRTVVNIGTAIANHANLTNKGSTYKAQTIDTIYLCTIVDELILNDSCVITVTFTGSTSVVLIGSSRQMVINRVGDVINLLFNNESYSLKKDQIEAALRPYLGSRTLIQAFG